MGKVASEIGLSPGTLRIWERRYGAPVPVRLPSGHRRYTGRQVVWLRKVAEALALGHRPSRVLRTTEDELDALLEEGLEAETTPDIRHWMDLARSLQTAELSAAITAHLSSSDDSLAHRLDELGVLLRQIGRAWAEGELSVRHEHFASEVIKDCLGVARREQLERRSPTQGPLVLSTLSGEEHELGLHLVDVLCASLGIRTCLVGSDTPLDEIVAAAEETDAPAVGISIPLSSRGAATFETLGQLRRDLPEVVVLLVGGEGLHRTRRLPGAKRFNDLKELESWLRKSDWNRRDD